MSDSELIVHPETERPRALVVASPEQTVEAFTAYQRLQKSLDEAMPDALMEIRGRRFRKKSYWRAIALAFNIDLELVREAFVEDGDDWGFEVTYRALAPNGRKADGDGTTMASEKGAGQASRHNVRAHAHTRAKNRAIADLVGFGEVSAEEMMESGSAPPRRQPSAPPQRSEGTGGYKTASKKQQARAWALASKRSEEIGVSREVIMRSVMSGFGIEHTEQMPPGKKYDDFCTQVETWDPPESEPAEEGEVF